MATRKQKLNFAIRRFKGFWSQFQRSKRGIVGLAIIVLFSLIAIFAPLVAPYPAMDPQFGVGQYPTRGLAQGLKIAEDLCKPAWYKYLPNFLIPRGQENITDTFFNLVTYYKEIGIFQTFSIEGMKSATDDSLRLTNRVSKILKVEAIVNGTENELSSPTQWYVDTSHPREVRIPDTYDNGTTFKVTYETGVDLVENMEIVKDHTFTSSQSWDEWEIQTNLPDQVTVRYNNVSGFSFIPQETKNRGCIEISYTSQSVLSENVEVNVSRPFEYPYFEPPESFYIHESVEVEGAATVNIAALIVNEDKNESFLIFSRTGSPQPKYEHHEIDSANPEVEKNIQLSPSQDRIFPTSGRYSLLIQLTFPSEQGDVKVYLDNVDLIIYGNVFGILGTDNGIPYPRDLFSLLVYGSRVSLLVGTLTALFSTVIGLFLGLISGYVGGIIDEGIMRFADLLLVLPTLPLFIVLIVSLRAVSGYVSMWNIIIILTFLGWMGFARSVRSMVLSIRERAFIEAAKAAGAGRIHIINRHIIPNVFALVYITLATACPGAIVVEASLSWLGLGDPTLPSWGKILYDFNSSSVAVTKGLTEYWFWVFPACVAIAILAAAFILVGYALDEILNPRLRERR